MPQLQQDSPKFRAFISTTIANTIPKKSPTTPASREARNPKTESFTCFYMSRSKTPKASKPTKKAAAKPPPKVRDPNTKYLTQSDGVGRAFITACSKMVDLVETDKDGQVTKRASNEELNAFGSLVSGFLGKLICTDNHSTSDLGKAWNRFKEFYPERADHLSREASGFVMMKDGPPEKNLAKAEVKARSTAFTAPIVNNDGSKKKHIIPELTLAVFNPQYADGFPEVVKGKRKSVRAAPGDSKSSLSNFDDTVDDNPANETFPSRALKRQKKYDDDGSEGEEDVIAGFPLHWWKHTLKQIRKVKTIGNEGGFETGILWRFPPDGDVRFRRYTKPGARDWDQVKSPSTKQNIQLDEANEEHPLHEANQERAPDEASEQHPPDEAASTSELAPALFDPEDAPEDALENGDEEMMVVKTGNEVSSYAPSPQPKETSPGDDAGTTE